MFFLCFKLDFKSQILIIDYKEKWRKKSFQYRYTESMSINSNELNATGNPACRPKGLLQETPFLFLQPHFSPPYSMCDSIKHTERENDPFQVVPHLTFRPLGNIKNSLCLYVSLLSATEKTYALFLFHWPRFQGAALFGRSTDLHKLWLHIQSICTHGLFITFIMNDCPMWFIGHRSPDTVLFCEGYIEFLEVWNNVF